MSRRHLHIRKRVARKQDVVSAPPAPAPKKTVRKPRLKTAKKKTEKSE